MEHSEQILVVDDEKTIRTVLTDMLVTRGYRVQTAALPADGLRLCEQNAFDLALIDLKMPGPIDGIDLLKELRRRFPATVVIMLTGFGALDSAIAALRQGAYDYLTKPASMAQVIESVERGLQKRRDEKRRQELIAHLEATLCDLKGASQAFHSTDLRAEERFVQTSALTIDRQKRLVVRGDQLIELTATEFDLLDHLARHSDRVVSARELAQAVQGYELMEVDARPIVRVHIQRLRQKLEDDPAHPRFIQNVRGRGYRFVE